MARSADKVFFRSSVLGAHCFRFIKKEYLKDTYEAHKDAADKLNSLRRDVGMALLF